MNRWLRVLLSIMFLLLLPGISPALTDQQRVLVGLKGVGVLVENIRPDAERLGLTRDQITTDVELRLRKAGIRVLSREERYKTPGMSYLYVNVNTAINLNALICAYSVSVELKEWVKLANGFKTPACIWITGSVGLTATDRLNKIRDSVGDKIDIFINDYLAANPK